MLNGETYQCYDAHELILTLTLTPSSQTVWSVSDLNILLCFTLQIILFDDFILKKQMNLKLQNWRVSQHTCQI